MFRRKPPAPTLPPEWLIVGLGNPGGEYKGTRHNVGFDVIDALAEKHRIKLDKSKHQARFGVGQVEGRSVALVRPLTFMNLSGRSVAPFLKELGLGPDRLLIVADDLDLALGRLRMKPKGSPGGHNGHKSIVASIGTQEYARLKVGIGRGGPGTIDHVLGTFTPEERVDIQGAIRRAIEGIETLVDRGLEAALNRINEGEPKGGATEA